MNLEELKSAIEIAEKKIYPFLRDNDTQYHSRKEEVDALQTLLSHAKLSLEVGKAFPKEKKEYKAARSENLDGSGAVYTVPDKENIAYNQALTDCNAVITCWLAEIPGISDKEMYNFPKGYTNSQIVAYQKGAQNVATAIQKSWEGLGK